MYSKDELRQLKIDFWEKFSRRCELHPELQFRKKKWVLHHTKIKDVALRFDVSRSNAQVMIELGNRNENLRLKAFEFLERYKVVIEDGFGNGLSWDFYHERDDSNKAVCRIYTQLDGVDFHRQNQWPQIFDFYIENMLRLEENFMQIRDLLQEELKSQNL